MTNKITGYTTGVYDLFHVGHVNLLKKAKTMCDYLIVGCSSDGVVREMKNKNPIIPYKERVEILKSIKYVDEVVEQTREMYLNKLKAVELFNFNKMFVGDDWKGSEKWVKLEQGLEKMNVEIVYFPYTKTTSSTKINNILDKILGEYE